MSSKVMDKALAGAWNLIEGEGGGKGGGGATEMPNSLQSKSIATVLDLISEGEIKGLVNGAQSIFLNKTPVQNQDGTYNFKGLSWAILYGLPDQPPIPGLTAVTSPATAFAKVELKASTGAVTYRVTDTTADAVIVTLSTPGLNSTDTKSGKMTGTEVDLDIQVKANATAGGAQFVDAVPVVLTGKCTSTYEEDFRLNLSQFGPGPWDIRITRTTADSTTLSLVNQTFWESLQIVYDHKFSFPYSAIMGLQVDSQYFGSSVPQRAYEIYGLIINVPSNYDPIARSYTGLWDGTFKQAWTNNPAWIFYDLCTNERYGVGIAPSFIDKWTLYSIGQYCDAVDGSGNYVGVPDGFGGHEPRFTFNGCLNQAEDAYTVLQNLAASFRGMTYWSAGLVTAAQDAPYVPTKIFTRANVIGGDFEYSGSSMLARNTVYVVGWQNPALGYEYDFEVIEDPKGIAKYGIRVKNMTALGCTSRGQAVRAGRWALAAEALNLDTVKFKTGFEGEDAVPGTRIYVADPSIAGLRMGGRLLSVAADGSSVTMDAPFVFAAGQTYELSVMTASGAMVTQYVSNAPGTTQTVQLVANLSTGDLPVVGAIFTLTEVGVVQPRIFQVISNAPDATGTQFEIVALQHDDTIYNIADNAASFDTAVANTFSALPNSGICQPAGTVTAILQTEQLSFGNRPLIYVSWVPSSDALLQGYIVSYQAGSGNWVTLPMQGSNSFEIKDPEVAHYTIRVMAVNQIGKPSILQTTTLDVTVPSAATGLNLISALDTPLGSGSFTGTDCSVTWKAAPISNAATSAPGNGVDQYFNNFRVHVYVAGTLVRTEYVTSTSYTYDIQRNRSDGAGRAFTIGIATMSKDGTASNEVQVACTNPSPALTAATISVTPYSMHMTFTPPNDPDYAGVVVYMSTANNFTPGPTNIVYQDIGNPTIPMSPGTTPYYVRYGFYDRFGMEGITLSAQQTISQSAINSGDLSSTAPAVPTGLTPATSTTVAADGTVHLVEKFTWTANVEPDLDGYEVSVEDSIDGGTTYGTAVVSWAATAATQFQALTGHTYRVKVHAVNKLGNKSADSTASVVTPSATTPAPAAITSTTAIGTPLGSYLAWTNPTNTDFDHVDIYRNTTNNAASATKIGSTKAAYYYDSGITPNTTYYYFGAAVNTSGTASARTSIGGGATPRYVIVGTDVAGNNPDLVTSYGYSAGFAGQKALATQDYADWRTRIANRPVNLSGLSGTEAINNATVALGVNTVIDSDMRRNNSTSQTSPVFFSGYNATGQTIQRNFTTGSIANGVDAYVTSNLTSAGGIFDLFSTHNPSSILPSLLRYGLPVQAGENLFAATYVTKNAGANWVYTHVYFWDKTGSIVAETDLSGGTPAVGSYPPNNDPSYYGRVGGFVTVPTNAVYASMGVRVSNPAGNSGDAHNYAIWPMMCKVAANQTAWPAYNSGLADRLSDQTSSNVASGIAGQGTGATTNVGALATRNTLDRTDGTLSGFGAIAGINAVSLGTSYIDDGAGGPVSRSLYRTDIGTAAGFSGQKTIATSGDFADVGGSTKPANNATRNTGALADLNYATNTPGNGGLYSTGRSAWLTDSGSNGIVTGLNNSSGFSGQTPWATLGTPTNSLLNPSPNLLSNPTFALAGSGWTATASSFSYNQGSGEGWYAANSSSSNSTGCALYQDVPVYGTAIYSLRAELYAGGLTGTGAQVRCYIAWLTSAKALISYSNASAIIGPGTSWTYCYDQNNTAPSNAAYARVLCDIWSPGAWSNTSSCWRRIKLEANTVSTPFSDERSNGAVSTSLWSTSYGALGDTGSTGIVTLQNTAAAFSGQKALATRDNVSWNTTDVQSMPTSLQPANLYGASGEINYAYVSQPGVATLAGRWPQEGGANVTENRNASGFANQKSIATSGSYNDLGSVPSASQNQAVNSSFKKGSYGWATVGAPTFTAPAGAGYDTTMNWSQSASIASGGNVDFAATDGCWLGGFSPGNKFLMPVNGAEVLWAQCWAGQKNCSFQLYLLCFDAGGSLIGAPAWSGATDYGTDAAVGNGDVAHYTKVGGFYTTPSGTRWAGLMFRALGTGASNPAAYVIRPAMGKAAANQTILPPYVPGPPDPFSDQTSSNTASGFAGQTAWATYSEYGPTSSTKPGANLIYDGGLRLGAQNWSNSGGFTHGFGSDVGHYMGTGSNGAILRSPAWNSSTPTTVYGGTSYTLSFDAGGGGGTAWTGYDVYAGFDWYDSSGNTISEVNTAITCNNGYQRYTITATSPSNAAYAAMFIYAPNLHGGFVIIKRVKFEIYGTATVFTDDRTNSAAYLDGNVLDNLKPAQAGADVTGSHSSTGFAGQTGWATLGASTNRVQYISDSGRVNDGRGLLPNGQTAQGYVTNPAYPLSSATPGTYIGVAATTLYLPNYTISLPSATISSLSASTYYSVFYDNNSSAYVAISSGTTAYFTDNTGRYIAMGPITTANSTSGSTGGGGGGLEVGGGGGVRPLP